MGKAVKPKQRLHTKTKARPPGVSFYHALGEGATQEAEIGSKSGAYYPTKARGSAPAAAAAMCLDFQRRL